MELAGEQQQLEQTIANVQAEIAGLKNAEVAAVDTELAAQTGGARRAAAGRDQPDARLSQPDHAASRRDQVGAGRSGRVCQRSMRSCSCPHMRSTAGIQGRASASRRVIGWKPPMILEFTTSQAIVDLTATDVPHPGDRWQRHSGARACADAMCGSRRRSSGSGPSDWIFAIGELVVMAGGKDVAFNRPVSALDSIEAAPSWAMSNLVDGFGSRQRVATAEGLDQRRQELEMAIARLQSDRKRLDSDMVLAKHRARRCWLRKPGCRRFKRSWPGCPSSSGSMPRRPPLPRPIHLLAMRGDVNSRGDLISPAGVVRRRAGGRVYVADPADEGDAARLWLPGSPIGEMLCCGGQS